MRSSSEMMWMQLKELRCCLQRVPGHRCTCLVECHQKLYMYQIAKFNIQFNIGRSLNQIKVVECEKYHEKKFTYIYISVKVGLYWGESDIASR